MRKLLCIAVLCAVLVGCTWADVERNATTTETLATKGAEVSGASTPVTGAYGTLAMGVLTALGYAAGAVRQFAKGRVKAQKLAKAAVAAAEATNGGGAAVSTAAALHGVGPEIAEAYADAVKTGTAKPKG